MATVERFSVVKAGVHSRTGETNKRLQNMYANAKLTTMRSKNTSHWQLHFAK